MSRWLLEPKVGMFVGNPRARVRDELWERSVKAIRRNGSVTQIWTSNNPQGFCFRQSGLCSRELIDFEGLALVKKSSAVTAATQKGDTTNI